MALFVGTLALYLFTLQPGLTWGDGIRLQREVITAESFILAEIVDVTFAPDPFPFARLGVAAWDHPLYVMLGYGLIRLLPGLDPLWVVNAISAVFGAGAIALLFWWLQAHVRREAALFGALALAVSHTFWWHAVTPEVYTLFAFLLLLALVSLEAYERHGRFRFLLLAAFAMGLGLANHLLAGLAFPALILYWLLARRNPLHYLRRWTDAFWLVLAFLIGFAPYWIQLLRMLRTFPLAEVLGPATGATFLQGSLALAPAALLRSLVSYLIFLIYQFNPLGVALGVVGFARGGRACPALWQKAIALYAVYALFGIVYQVSDQFAFFLGAHLFFAAGIGMGADYLLTRVWPQRRRLLTAVLAASILVMPLLYATAPTLLRAVGVDDAAFGVPQIGTGVRDGLAYYITPNKRGDTAAADFGRAVLDNLPSDALVLAEWYVDTDEYFVLRYFAVVEGLRPDLEMLGWPTVDPFSFDPALAVTAVETALPVRPVYLASLSEEFYAASELLARYCIVPEHSLYRVLAREEGEAAQRPCLPPDAATMLP